MKNNTLLASLFLIFALNMESFAQVSTNFNNKELISLRGKFDKDYNSEIQLEIKSKNIDSLIENERYELESSAETKPFRLAVPVPVDIDIANKISWINENDFSFGKFVVKSNGALSISINFDKFRLPNNTEMYLYNEKGEMISGTITEKENNINKIWGSWVYKGEYLNIEIKTPKETKQDLVIHANNVAYGYKEVYKSEKVNDFGASGSCNINVLCSLGNSWVQERNSVGLILGSNGTTLCTGSLIMNNCGNNRSFFLTANHCYNADQNVAAWRFTFQAWSPTCTPTQNSNGITFNGSTLKANNSNSDFCLLELNNIPPLNSGITYSGWSRSATPAINATAIHHPRGDVMKISKANNSVSVASINSTVNQYWKATWNQGVTEGGSSGSPLFDQNNRIIGQLYGGPSACGGQNLYDYYGRFDMSWTGGGTPSSRLSNWLDPLGTNQMTTNTTNVNNLLSTSFEIIGPPIICTTANYSISNLPIGAVVTWSISNTYGVLVLTPNNPSPNQLLILNNTGVTVITTLTANISNLGCNIPNQTKTMTITNDSYRSPNIAHNYYQEPCFFYTSHPSQSGISYNNSNPTFVHAGCMVYVNLNYMTGRNVTLSGGTPLFWQVSSTTYYPNTLYFQLPYNSGGIPFTFNINGNGACYQESLLFFAYSGNAKFSFNASPNPAKDILTITANSDQEFLSSKSYVSINENQIFQIDIYDIFNNNLKISKKMNSSLMFENIDVSNLRSGLYLIKISTKDQVETLKFFKE